MALRMYHRAHKLSLEFSRRFVTSFPSRLAKIERIASRCWHIGAENLSAASGRIPIIRRQSGFRFSRCERFYPLATAQRWERAVTTPNNFPWSYFHNKKLEIGFPLTRASICRLRCRPFHCPFLVRSILLGRWVTNLSSSSLDYIRLYYVSVSPVLSPLFPMSTHPRCLVPRMKSAKGHGECDERGNVRMCRSRNHLIVL